MVKFLQDPVFNGSSHRFPVRIGGCVIGGPRFAADAQTAWHVSFDLNKQTAIIIEYMF